MLFPAGAHVHVQAHMLEIGVPHLRTCWWDVKTSGTAAQRVRRRCARLLMPAAMAHHPPQTERRGRGRGRWVRATDRGNTLAHERSAVTGGRARRRDDRPQRAVPSGVPTGAQPARPAALAAARRVASFCSDRTPHRMRVNPDQT